MPAQPEFQKRLQSIEVLLGEIESVADPNLRTNVRHLVQLVMDLHGAGLERIVDRIQNVGDGGETILEKLGRDELVSSLLVLHGLHPLDFDARVAGALDKVRPRLRSQDGEVELLSTQGGEVRLRLQANGHGCGSTAQTFKEMVENAVYQAAPDVTSLVIEGATDKQGFVPLEMLQGRALGLEVPNGHSLVAVEEGGL
jgi:Fe-S cluster biogenesis protein NfuA